MFTNDIGNNNLQIILQNSFIDTVTTYCLESKKKTVVPDKSITIYYKLFKNAVITITSFF